MMSSLLKILHIDKKWKIYYILVWEGTLVENVIPIKSAVTLLEKQKFDLILSEPHNIAIFDSERMMDEASLRMFSSGEKSCNLLGIESGVQPRFMANFLFRQIWR